jgi:uncharacterized protein (TIGR02265 family)
MHSGKRIYAAAVRALFLRGLENRLTPACQRYLREAGLDVEGRLEPTYSLEQWRQYLRLAAEHLYGGLPAAVAYQGLGERYAEGLFSSVSGGVLLGLAKVLGPQRMLQHLPLWPRTRPRAGAVQVSLQGPQAVELRVEDVLVEHPTFLAGLVARAVEHAGGHQVTVTPEQFDGQGCTLRVSWHVAEEAGLLPRLFRRRLEASSSAPSTPA